MIPFLYYDLFDFVTKILNFLSNENCLSNKDGLEIQKLDFSKKDIWLRLKDVTQEYPAETAIASTIKRRDGAKSNEIYTFRKECQMFLATMIGKVLERSPLGSSILGIIHSVRTQIFPKNLTFRTPNFHIFSAENRKSQSEPIPED